jgi:hypothetical protein
MIDTKALRRICEAAQPYSGSPKDWFWIGETMASQYTPSVAAYLTAAIKNLPALVDELDAARADAESLRKALKLMEHKVITCGVAASTPDAELTRRAKCYAEDWNSPQAEAVRALRADRDAARAELERLRARVADFEAEWRHYSTDNATTACGLSVGDRVMASIVEARVTCPKCDEVLAAELEGK